MLKNSVKSNPTLLQPKPENYLEIAKNLAKKIRQIDARIFPLIEMLDFAILKGLYLKNRRKPLSVTFSDEITTPEESFQIGSRPSLPQHQKI